MQSIRGHFTRGAGILNNELYVGRRLWNRQRFVKDPATGRRRSRRNDSERLIVKEVPELRIVSDQLWNAVKARQAAIRESEGVTKARATPAAGVSPTLAAACDRSRPPGTRSRAWPKATAISG